MSDPAAPDHFRAKSAFLARMWASPNVLLTLTILFWSGNLILGRAVRGNFPPVALTFWRWVLALAILTPFAWGHVKRDRAVLVRSWPILLLLSVFGVSAYNSLAYTGLARTSAINGAILQSSMSPLVLIAALVFFGERPTLARLAGVVISMVGVLVVVAQGSFGALAEIRLNVGDGFILAGVASYAVYTVFLRRRPATHPLSLLAATLALGIVVLIPVYGAELASGRTIRLVPASGLALAYVAIFPSLVAYLCFNRGVELIGSGRAGQFIHLMPVFATILAVLFLGERLHAYHLAGAAIIFLGILVSSLGKAKTA